MYRHIVRFLLVVTSLMLLAGNCAPVSLLTTFQINGPDFIPTGGSAEYTATGLLSDGSSPSWIDASTVMTVDSPHCYFGLSSDHTLYNANFTSSDQQATIKAWCSIDGVYKETTKSVRLERLPELDEYCGDGSCSATETCMNCPRDCGACPPACGDGSCNGAETCTSCPSDCGACPPACGDGACNGGETCSSCATDCGVCPPACGDGTCNGNETCSTCAEDCGGCNLEFTYSAEGIVAEQQYASGQIPLILKEENGLLILQMPAGQTIDGWHTGTVILVQDIGGKLHHKMVLHASNLVDGTVAVLAEPVTLLSAVDLVSITIDNPTARIIADDTYAFDWTQSLSGYPVDLSSVFGCENCATLDWQDTYIQAAGALTIKLEINTPVIDTIAAVLNALGGHIAADVALVAAFLDDGTIDSEEDMRILQQRLEVDAEFRNRVDAVLQAKEDPNRIKEAYLLFDGTLKGKVHPQLVLSGSLEREETIQILPADILIPVAGPVQVSLNASLVLGTGMSGTLALAAGAEFGAKLYCQARWPDQKSASISTLPGWNDYLQPIEPTINAEGNFWAKVGLQPEIGLSVFEIVGLTVQPEAYARLDATATLSGTPGATCASGSFDVSAGVEASVQAEFLAWETEPYTFFSPSPWHLWGPFTWDSPPGCSGGGGEVCGNGTCGGAENNCSCPQDCPGQCGGGGPCESACGDGVCESYETCGSCPGDCCETVSAPTIRPARGTFAGQVTATITSSGQAIYYTTDGTEPIQFVSPKYLGPLTFSSGTVTLKAKAFTAGVTDSPTSTARYTIQSVASATNESEPNNSLETSDGLSFSGCSAVVRGALSADDGYDHFVFTANAGDAISTSASVDTGNLDGRVKLYNAQGASLWTGYYSYQASGGFSDFVVASAGTYYILVDRYYGGTGTYTLHVTNSGNDGPYGESEPNNSLETSNGLSFSGCSAVVRGALSADDGYDHFVFTANAGDAISASASVDTGNLDGRVKLYNAQGASLWTGYYSYQASGGFSDFVVASAGTYYILVDRYYGGTGTYTLHVTNSGNDGPYGESEPNNSLETSNPLPFSAGAASIRGVLSTDDGYDHFVFTANAGDAISASASVDTGNLDGRVKLYNTQGASLWTGYYSYQASGGFSDFVVASAGTYYILVDRYYGGTGTYTLRVTK